MARDLALLEADFQEKVRKLLALCEKDGFPMKPFYTLRSVYDQAKLYRQSRTKAEIDAAHSYLMDRGAPFLAGVLLSVGPQNGAWATNALPGFSWHQHGEAVDCYWLVNGNAEWSTSKLVNGENGYNVYAKNAQKLGLEPGHFWSSKDSVHVQKSTMSINKLIELGKLSFPELDEKMKSMFDLS